MHHYNHHHSSDSLPALACATTARPSAQNPFCPDDSPTLHAVLVHVDSCSPTLRAKRLARFAREHGVAATAVGAALVVDGQPIDCRDSEQAVAELGVLLGY